MIPNPHKHPFFLASWLQAATLPNRVMRLMHHVALACLLALLPMSAAVASDTTEVVLGGEQFTLELALDPDARNRGLMFRNRIDTNGGMLFVFPNHATRSFWMKNCLVDMDILFLDNQGVVVSVLQMFAEPLQQEGESLGAYHQRLRKYPSGSPARFAIELRHGTATRLGIEPGHHIELDVENLVSMAR